MATDMKIFHDLTPYNMGYVIGYNLGTNCNPEGDSLNPYEDSFSSSWKDGYDAGCSAAAEEVDPYGAD